MINNRNLLNMINSNIGLVKTEAEKMYCILQGTDSNMDLEDLMQEGYIGLYKAAESFDDIANNAFCAYAAPIVRQSIRRAVCQQSRLVRIPENQYDDYAKIQRAIMECKEADPAASEIDYIMVAFKSGIPLKKVKNLITRVESGRYTVSLNTPISNDGTDDEEDMINFIAADVEDITDILIARNTRAILRAVLDTLSKREKLVLIERFGLNGDEAKTLEKIGKDICCSGERARQIINMILAKIRNGQYSSLLRDCL